MPQDSTGLKKGKLVQEDVFTSGPHATPSERPHHGLPYLLDSAWCCTLAVHLRNTSPPEGNLWQENEQGVGT
jgi:hypothetical protein